MLGKLHTSHTTPIKKTYVCLDCEGLAQSREITGQVITVTDLKLRTNFFDLGIVLHHSIWKLEVDCAI